jgi:AI-2 transport protein TqsA
MGTPSHRGVGQASQAPAPTAVGGATFRVLLPLAATVVILAGLYVGARIVTILLLAVVFTVLAYPLRMVLRRRRVPAPVATLVVVILVFVVLLALLVSTVYALAEFSRIVGTYSDQIEDAGTSVEDFLRSAGLDSHQAQDLLSGLDLSSLLRSLTGLLGSVVSFGSGVVFLGALVILLAIDSAPLTDLSAAVRRQRPYLVDALAGFSESVRRYLVVTAVAGAVVAALDGVGLVVLGIEAPLVWVLLAFITNFIPSVGFVIGVVPPVVLALLSSSWQTAAILAVIYCVVNVVIQSVLQPLVVHRSVGLNQTMNFVSLIVWSAVLGPLGALLAIPMTLLARAVLVDANPSDAWVHRVLGGGADDEPAPPPIIRDG